MPARRRALKKAPGRSLTPPSYPAESSPRPTSHSSCTAGCCNERHGRWIIILDSSAYDQDWFCTASDAHEGKRWFWA